jgi:hypothetical protein
MTDTVLDVAKEPCPDCGRPYTPRLSKLGGRSEDYLYSPEKGWVPPAILTFPLKSLSAIQETQLIQKEKGEIIVRYSLRPQAKLDLVQIDVDHIREGMLQLFGKAMAITFEEVDSFPRGPTGKFKWVECELDDI